MSTLTSDLLPIYFSKDPILIRIESEKMTGPAPYTPDEPNLSCFIKLEQYHNNNWSSILSLSAAYSRHTKQVDQDLSATIVQLQPPYPGEHLFLATIPDNSLPFTRSVGTYRIVHADQFGTPLVTDGEKITAEFKAIRGASSYWQGLGSDADTRSMILLHSYKVNFRGYRHVSKTIAPDQPEVIYHYISGSPFMSYMTDVNYSDGSTTSISRFRLYSTPPGGALYAEYVSMSQLGLLAAGKDIDSYTLTISNGLESETIHYTVDNSPNNYAIDILYENGCGGMEVVRMNGRHGISHAVQSRKVQKSRWYGSNFRDGLSQNVDHRGAPTLELNTGYQNKDYLLYLSQMLYGDIWYIDHARKELIRYNVNTNSVKPNDDIKDIEAFNITATRAVSSPTASTFGE